MTTPAEDQIIAERRLAFAAEEARALIAQIEQDRDAQPDRLAKARSEAEAARAATLAAEPWDEAWNALPLADLATGELTGMMALPTINGKELWGTRAAFDFLDAGTDSERIDECLDRYFTALDGNPEHLFMVFSAALCTIAEHVAPVLVDKLERYASDYNSRVLFADAARNAWATRLKNGLRPPVDEPSCDEVDGEQDEPW